MNNHLKFVMSMIAMLAIVECSACGSNSSKPTADSTGVETACVKGQDTTEKDSPLGNKIVISDVDPKHANGTTIDDDAAMRALLKAYPDFIEKIEDNTVYFKDGSNMPFDDGRKKDFNTLLDEGDIQDMFFIPYSSEETPAYLADAGRSRSDALFKKMYGNSQGAVSRTLVNVPWFGKNVKFTKNNGAADALKKVAEELAKHPELKKYLESSGTFYWRPVRGAKRMSAHSYGIAFDIAVPYSNYWQWDSKSNDELRRIKYTNRFPKKIVEIFEKHGFIWGGAWYHYDTMHFEYRPELLNYAKEVM